MNYELIVQKVTEEVMKALGNNDSGANISTLQSTNNLPANRNILVLLTGSRDYQEEIKSATMAMSSSWNVQIWASAGALGAMDKNILSNGINGKRINSLSHEDIPGILEGICAVVVPNLTLNTLSLVSNLSTPTAASNLLVSALAMGKRVIAGEDCIIPAGSTPTKAMCDKIQCLVDTVASYGIKFVSTKNLSAMVEQCLSTLCDGTAAACLACGLCIIKRPEDVRKLVDAGAQRIGATSGISVGVGDKIGGMIDHTLLKPDATHDQVIKLCEEAAKYKFASVCINPAFISLCKKMLKGSGVKVCTVVGFPLGATSVQAKAFETRQAVSDGADEIDMVINVGALKSGDFRLVEEDIRAVRSACPGKVLKVILETALLTDDEKVKACTLSKAANADFVKTSTGFGPGGATVEDIALMRKTVGPRMGVKASGGVRDRETALKMVEAGATRIGASASVAIVKDEKNEGKGY